MTDDFVWIEFCLVFDEAEPPHLLGRCWLRPEEREALPDRQRYVPLCKSGSVGGQPGTPQYGLSEYEAARWYVNDAVTHDYPWMLRLPELRPTPG